MFLGQGEKNNGFDVLYHNMKHGQISTKELADFVRESSHGAPSYSHPESYNRRGIFQINDKTSKICKQLFTTWTKEEVAGTLEAVQAIQNITQALQKSKENYNAKCVEQERLKKEGATQREIEKIPKVASGILHDKGE
ncbi:hypothetical protein A6R68_16782 [Neotoma lepida]|uniref:Uncharacterized protein n=1 Tax=Neotoma lepida TaxID=56216 RepID=A0A1A6HFP1_NEOLE|nr:hypothetical protein A6R68_16782 [Neotoma lepida]